MIIKVYDTSLYNDIAELLSLYYCKGSITRLEFRSMLKEHLASKDIIFEADSYHRNASKDYIELTKGKKLSMESIWIYKNDSRMSLEDSTIRWNEIQDIGVVIRMVNGKVYRLHHLYISLM